MNTIMKEGKVMIEREIKKKRKEETNIMEEVMMNIKKVKLNMRKVIKVVTTKVKENKVKENDTDNKMIRFFVKV